MKRSRRRQSTQSPLSRWRKPLVEPLEQRQMLAVLVELVKDISNPGSSDPQQLIVSGNNIFFTATTSTTGRELYRSDGSLNSAIAVADIRPGAQTSDPQNFIDVNGTLFFTADNGTNGRELYSVVGGGQPTLLDINPGGGSSNPGFLTNVSGTLYFAASNGINGRELFSATAGSFQLVKDLNPGAGSSNPQGLANVNGTLFLGMDDGSSGMELYTVNGASATRVMDINPGSAGSDVRNGANVGGRYFFSADNGVVGAELWVSNGTQAGTNLVLDINTEPSINNGSSDVQNIADLNGLAVFGATDLAGGIEPWTSDGTAFGTFGIDLTGGSRYVGYYNYISYYGSFGSYPNNLTSTGNLMFFSADLDPGTGTPQRELYSISNFFPIPLRVLSSVTRLNPQYLVNAAGELYFAGTNSANGTEIWRSDGTANGTVVDFDVNKGAASSDPTYLVFFNGYIYFSGTDGTATGRELYRTVAVGPNSAPVLNNTGSPSLTSINEDVTPTFNFGTSVTALIASGPANMITDPDTGALQGIAVTGTDTTGGTWEFSTNGGLNWNPIGQVSDNSALLLGSSAFNVLRFLPNADYFGTMSSAITFRAWDQYSGSNGTLVNVSTNGGYTPFSSAVETASLIVRPIADTPVSISTAALEDSPTAAIRLLPAAVDGTSVTNFQITGISGGQLFAGAATIASGAFITAAQGAAGLTFVPSANRNNIDPPATPFGFNYQAATGSTAATLGGNQAPVNISVLPVADLPTVTNSTTNEDTLSFSGLVITRNAVDPLSVTNFLITGITGGTLFLNNGVTPVPNNSYITTAQGLAGLRFLPSPNSTTSGSFVVQGASDTAGNGLGTTASALVTVNPVNDAPTSSVPGPQISLIGTNFPYSAATGNPIRVSDVDSGASNILVTVSVTNGTLLVPGAPGSGTATVTITAPLAAANALLDTLQYVPPTPTFTGAVTISVNVNDMGNTGLGGSQAAVTSTITNTVLPPNVAPLNTTPLVTQNFDEDTAFTFSTGGGNVISVTDADAATNPIVTTLNASNGSIGVNVVGGLTITGNNTATVTLTGDQANIRAALDGMVFTPTPNFNGAATIVVSTNDQGFFGFGGPRADSDTVFLNIAAVNDAPVNTVPASGATVEDQPLTFPANSFSVSDVDSGASDIVVTVTAGNGRISVLSIAGVTYAPSASSPSVQMTGPVNLIASALATLTYTPNPGFFGNDTISVITSDQGNTGSGGALGAISAVPIFVQNINRAPVHTFPANSNGSEDAAIVFSTGNGNRIGVNDVDSAAAPIITTLTAANGTLFLPDTTGLTVTGNGTAQVTITGPVATINTRLDGLVFTPTLNFNGNTTIVLSSNDQGNSGFGGPRSTNDTANLFLAPVNDAPINTVPGNQNAAANSPSFFQLADGTGIRIADVDAGLGFLQVNLAVVNGRVTVANTAGVLVTGNGTPALQLIGSVDTINAALEGMRFDPDVNFLGLATLTITTNDLGNTGAGGPMMDVDPVIINVRSPFEIDGTILYVTGSGIDDILSLNFTSDTTFTAFVNGLSYSNNTGVINEIHFTGGAGNDQLTINDSAADSVATFSPFGLDLLAGGYRLLGATSERIIVNGSFGDSAVFNGSAGDDTFTASPGFAVLSGAGFSGTVNGFGLVNAISGGGNDQATLYDSAGDDWFVGYPDIATMNAAGYRYAASFFPRVVAVASTGNDIASFVGSAGDDQFYGAPTYSQLIGAGYNHRAQGFDHAYAFSMGGNDTSSLYDSTGNDVYYGLQDYSLIYNANYFVESVGFLTTYAYASSGTDIGVMFDTAANDNVVALYNHVYVTSPLGMTYHAVSFDQVFAFSSVGGTDIATLYDSTANDQFIALQTHSAMIGPGYFNQAQGFSEIDALAYSGGVDIAYLFDSPVDDTLTAGGFDADMFYGAGNRVGVNYFDTVIASSSTGTNRRQTQAVDFALQLFNTWTFA